MRIKLIYKLTLTALGLASLGLLLLFPGHTSAANPTTINFQGKVVNANGTNVADNISPGYGFVFKLYTVSSGGSAIWTESDTLPVVSGVFQVNLGAVCPFFTSNACNGSTPIDFSASNSLYLGITFNSDPAGEMSPRVQLQSVPYSFYSDNSGKLGGLSAGNFVQLAQGLQSISSSSNPLIYLEQNGGSANILQLQSGSTSVLTLNQYGFLTLQPSLSIGGGSSGISQTLTLSASSGQTAVGYDQSVTISNTSAATAEGIRILMTDGTTFANGTYGINVGITNTGANSSKAEDGISSTITDNASSSSVTNIAVSAVTQGSNAGQIQYALNAQANHGVAVVGASTGAGGSITCGPTTAADSIGVCGTTTLASSAGYGGYFAATGNGGTAFYATNGTSTANLLQLQINGVNAMLVDNNGVVQVGSTTNGSTITFAATGNSNATIRKNTTVTGAINAHDVVMVDTSNAGQVKQDNSNNTAVFGVATATNASTAAQDIATGGIYQVNLSTTSAAVAIGDDLIAAAASDAGKAIDGGPCDSTIRMVGRALEAKSAGVGGTIWTLLSPTSGNTGTGSSGACAAPSPTTLQNAYNNSTGSTTPEIVLSGGDNTGVDIQNSFGSPVTGSLFAIRTGASSGLGSILFGVDNAGTTTVTSTGTSAFKVQGAASVLTVDTTDSITNAQGINSSATLGSELVDSGGSTSCSGTNWSGSGHGPYTHSAGSTAALACTPPSSVTNGANYQIEFTTASVTAGSVIPNVGGAGATAESIYDNETNQFQVINAGASGAISFVPTTDFVGSVTIQSIKIITNASQVVSINNSDATPGIEIRSGGSGENNTFIGINSGQTTTSSGSDNIALGNKALGVNTSGYDNVAVGYESLYSNSTGVQNIGIGTASLVSNTTGSGNTAGGYFSLFSETTGNSNTAFGDLSLENTTSGSNNTAIGIGAGKSITQGVNNTFLGSSSGNQDPNSTTFATVGNLQNATAVGYGSQVQESNAIVLGGVGTTSSNLTPNVGIGTTSPTNLFSVSPDIYDTGTACQGANSSCNSNGTSLWGTGTTWTSSMVGDEFIFADGTKYTITGFISTTQLTVATSTTKGGSNHYRIHNPAFSVSSTGQTSVRTSTNSTTAFQVQNAAGSTVLAADTSGGQVLLGNSGLAGKLAIYNGSNAVTIQAGSSTATYNIILPASSGSTNQCLANTSTPGTLQWIACGAGSTATVVLAPEFTNATFSGVGGTNTGTLTSDYCAGSSRFPSGENTAVCTNATDEHNYYSWTGNSGNSYDIFVRWSVPNDFASFSSGSFYYWKTASGDTVTMNVYNASSTACATQSGSGTTGAWPASPQSITMTGCTPSAGSVITIDIHLAVAGSGSDFARIGEISLTYNRN